MQDLLGVKGFLRTWEKKDLAIYNLILKPQPSHPRINSEASTLSLSLIFSHFSSSSSFFSSYPVRFIRYIAANTPIIANKKLKPGIGVVVGDSVGVGEAV